jgi:hypothetical protein
MAKEQNKVVTVSSSAFVLDGVKVTKKMSLRFSDDTPKEEAKELTVVFDYSGCTGEEVMGWATADRVIATARAIRGACKSQEQFDNFVGAGDNTLVVMARDAGKRPSAPKTPAQIAAEARGMSKEDRKALIAKLQAQMDADEGDEQ